MNVLRSFLAASLLILPGAWLSLGLPFVQLSVPARLALAVPLSAPVVVLQFFLLRLAGAGVDATAFLICALNLPCVWLVFRACRTAATRSDDFRVGPADLALYAFLVACVSVPWFLDSALRIFAYHAWLHESIVDQFSAGALLPEEPELAGVRLAYPWLAHVYWAVLCTVGAAPLTTWFVFTNLAWLAAVTVLVLKTCRTLGVRPASSRIALLALVLGTNYVGFLVFEATGWLPGDLRYTPWIRKFMIAEQSALGLSLIAALMAVVVRMLQSPSRRMALLAAFLTMSTGLFYPQMLPPAAVLVGLTVLALFAAPWWAGVLLPARPAAWWLAAGLVVALGVAGAYLASVTAGRSASPIMMASLDAIGRRFGRHLIVLLPFLIGVAFMPRQRWRDPGVAVLTLASAVCLGAASVFMIGPDHLEYKLMFGAALTVVPAAALVEQRVFAKDAKWWMVVLAAAALLPILSLRDSGWIARAIAEAPAVHETGPLLVVAETDPEASWISAIRTQTPGDAVVAVRSSALMLPPLTGRALYAPPEQLHGVAPGYWLDSKIHMIGVRGYPSRMVERRLDVLQSLFGGSLPSRPAETLDQLRVDGRPVVLVYEPRDGRAFLDWLKQRGAVTRIAADGPTELWMTPRQAMARMPTAERGAVRPSN